MAEYPRNCMAAYSFWSGEGVNWLFNGTYHVAFTVTYQISCFWQIEMEVAFVQYDWPGLTRFALSLQILRLPRIYWKHCWFLPCTHNYYKGALSYICSICLDNLLSRILYYFYSRIDRRSIIWKQLKILLPLQSSNLTGSL